MALLVFLQTVDAADHGRLAGAGRTADHDALAARDGQVDVTQDVELAVPLVDGLQFDNRLSHDCESPQRLCPVARRRSEEHTSELQSLMRNSYAVFCLKK